VSDRTHELVVRHVEQLLVGGGLRPGDRLPSERVLAEQLGVGRPSVREALKVLEALGVVRSSPGQGRGSAAVVVARPGEAIGAAMRLHVATSSLPVADLVETRVLLESASVQALAARVTREGGAVLTRPAALLTAMAEPGLEPDRFHALDAAFHVALAEAAGNAVVAVVMGALREAIQGYVLAAVERLPDWGATARGLRSEHEQLLGAVAAGDGDLAAGLMATHIRGFLRRAGTPAAGGH
jgi:GntR family transcriptional repressor for pyruvate dehydrogenase complex